MGNRNRQHRSGGKSPRTINSEKRQSKITRRKETEDQRIEYKNNLPDPSLKLEEIFTKENLVKIRLINKMGVQKTREYIQQLEQYKRSVEPLDSVDEQEDSIESEEVLSSNEE